MSDAIHAGRSVAFLEQYLLSTKTRLRARCVKSDGNQQVWRVTVHALDGTIIRTSDATSLASALLGATKGSP